MNNSIPDQRLRNAAEIVLRTTHSATRQELENGSSDQTVQSIIANAHQLTDSIIREVVESVPPVQRPVCCEGCSACCYLHVVATPLEVLAAAQWISKNMSPEDLALLKSRIDEQIERTTGINAVQRRQIRPPCPLLVAGRCSIYSIRPTTCRGWNSLDRSVCDTDLLNPTANITAPVNLGQYILAGRVAEGLNSASASLGLEAHQLDFVRGLKIALVDPARAAKDWRAGVDIFSDAVNQRVFPDQTSHDEEQTRNTVWKSN